MTETRVKSFLWRVVVLQTGVFSQLELAMIRARVKSGMENAKSKGKRIADHERGHHHGVLQALSGVRGGDDEPHRTGMGVRPVKIDGV